MAKDIVFRCVGFREIWDLLDLDRYDEVLLEDMRRTSERIDSWLIELYETDTGKNLPATSDKKPTPVSASSNGVGKSLGKMPVDAAKMKFL